MHQPLRGFYDTLSVETRTRIRTLLPKGLLRWYAHRTTDVYLISYPKCGRTWLRLLIGHVIASHFSLPHQEDILLLKWEKGNYSQLPRICTVHDDRPMFKSPGELEKSKTKFRNKDVIFLVRDPRDVIISSFFEISKRGQLFGENPYEARQTTFNGNLHEFINRQIGGFNTIIEYYNIWAANRHIPKNFLLVRYEDLQENTQKELRRVLDFLGLEEVEQKTIESAVQFSSFENMRKMEASSEFKSPIMKSADQSDDESYKTRKGKVKGYVDYLGQDEINRLNHIIETSLSDYFGYTV